MVLHDCRFLATDSGPGWHAGGKFSWSALTPMVQCDVNFAKIDATCYAALHALCDESKGGHAGEGCYSSVGDKHDELQTAKCTPSDTQVWCDGVSSASVQVENQAHDVGQ